MTPALRQKLANLPRGSFGGRAHGRAYIVTVTSVAGGRGWKVRAEALNGTDYISANIYDLSDGPVLKPCEMPADKVCAFLADLSPDQ